MPRVFRAYGLPLVEWRDTGSALLLSVGAGLLMSVMDTLPVLRWGVDMGGMIDSSSLRSGKLKEALVWADRLVSAIVVAAWWSVSDPTPVRAALAEVTSPLFVYSNEPLPGEEHPTLFSLCETVREKVVE